MNEGKVSGESVAGEKISLLLMFRCLSVNELGLVASPLFPPMFRHH